MLVNERRRTEKSSDSQSFLRSPRFVAVLTSFVFSMAQMNKNAQSLTGASGIGLKAQAIPAVGNRAKVKVVTNGKAPVVRAAPKKEVPKALTSTEKLLAANEAKK